MVAANGMMGLLELFYSIWEMRRLAQDRMRPLVM